jgi:hypothetical protein
MSVSLPSRDVYSVDVPEPTGLTATFQYNYFVPDEGVSETGGVPDRVLNRPADEVDAEFLHYASSRSPRYVLLRWSAPKIVSSSPVELDIRKQVFGGNRHESLISDSVDKIVSEDYFASDDYVGVMFNDGELDDKAFMFMSGSLLQLTAKESREADVSHFRASQKLHSVAPAHVTPTTIGKSLNQPSRAYGGRFFSNRGVRLRNEYFDELRNVHVSVQVNGKLLHDIVGRAIDDPYLMTSNDFGALKPIAARAMKSLKNRRSSGVAEKDFKVFVPYVHVRMNKIINHQEQDPAYIVGYIVDKVEHKSDGTVKQHPSIIIENPRVTNTFDVRVKYGSTYSYTVRAVALFNVPAIDDDTDDVAVITTLVSSKPSQRMQVKCTEMRAPPPPSDINFIWNYENDKLTVTWAFPPNPQRDVKKFQIYRRRTIDEPFELLKEYDFNDSALQNALTMHHHESPSQALVEVLDSPKLFFIDDEFNRGRSKYIYTVCCVDAHGLTSGYGAQFQVWFDVFQNKIMKKLISHQGAPKPYPNLYLEADTFVDTIRVSGPHAKRLKIYFNPECYQIVNDRGRATEVVAMKQHAGMYKLQLLNLDNQLGEMLNISIDDRMKLALKRKVTPAIKRAGPLRIKRA